MSTLSVEYAKSSRSTCKACKNKIEKGSVRIGTHSTFDDRTMTQWRCLDCFSVTKKWKDTDPETIDVPTLHFFLILSKNIPIYYSFIKN